MDKQKVLIIDDNRSILSALEMLLRVGNIECSSYVSPDQGFNAMQKQPFHAILLDMNFKAGVNSGNEGLYWLNRFRETAPDTSVVMMTAYGDVDLAVKAIKNGAYDFVLKPWENEKLLATLKAAINYTLSQRELTTLKGKEKRLIGEINKSRSPLVGRSAAMNDVLRMVAKVAVTDANVLITGENGTGKELIAREIHRLSLRTDNVLVGVDMGALPETLFESELFGHRKGAFTDAREDRIGKFEVASGGSLFLDEIGNIPLHLQSKLLAALQNRSIVRLGENTPRAIDIRLISATNRNLEEMTANGTFREDLLYRINTITIEVPPLRQRSGDITLLANYFIEKYASKYGKTGLLISQRALQKLEDYCWPGNVRELQHTIEKAVILADSLCLDVTDFVFRAASGANVSLEMTLDEMENKLIEAALQRHQGNFSAAAGALGITRQTLYNKMKRYETSH
jgi:DNA-binding NtrC family response regulator